MKLKYLSANDKGCNENPVNTIKYALPDACSSKVEFTQKQDNFASVSVYPATRQLSGCCKFVQYHCAVLSMDTYFHYSYYYILYVYIIITEAEEILKRDERKKQS